MLELKDFIHLPQIDALFDRLVAEGPGLVVVAGLDPRAAAATPMHAGSVLPSGRSTLFGMLVRQLLSGNPTARIVVLAEDRRALRIPRPFGRHVEWVLAESGLSYADQLASALRRSPDILIVDRLNAANAAAALKAAQGGVRAISQIDCVFFGSGVARHLLDLGATREQLQALTWVVSVQRLPALCGTCKEPALPEPEKLRELRRLYPHLMPGERYYRASGCAACKYTGRSGDVAAFDFFRSVPAEGDVLEQRSLLPMEEYVLGLAALGHVSLDDVIRLDADQLRRTYSLLTASERALGEANDELRRKLAEIEVANRVLQQKTESLISLQEIAQTLITSTELAELANRVGRRAHELCGADRSILYLLRPDETAEVLSVSGWDPALLHVRLDARDVFGASPAASPGASVEAAPFNAWPPGIPQRSPDVEGAALRAGLRVPLVAQNEVVGLMIVHSTRKSRFPAGEIAVLQTLANQAAIAIQRTGLIEALRDKIVRLEEAQVELVKKERLERELELARQVQQSLLPRTFPDIEGYRFGARNEAARRVGGDFYDAFLLDSERFGVVIADVSDKGMPAALFMALTRSLILAEARREPSPRAVLTSVHRLLLELGGKDMFVTVFYGVVDTASRRMTYARAGHEEPLLLRSGMAHPLSARGTLLGSLDEDQLKLTEEQLVLQPGDRLVLFTDGLTDGLAPDGQPYGIERLQQVLLDHSSLGPAGLCAATFSELNAFRGDAEQFDDMAMLVVAVDD